MTILLSALAAVLYSAWGAFWAFIRDQGQPTYLTEAQKKERGPSKWKEAGIALFGLPIGLLWLRGHGIDPVPLVTAALIWASMSGTWSFGHASGLGLYDWTDAWEMTWTGAAVTLGPAVALAVSGRYVLALVVLMAGAMKVVTYWLAYRFRGRVTPWPHATAFGHVAHGAIAQGVTAACMVLA
jgi:hypothetical protein